jgi:multidrug efflux pump
MYFTDIFIRKPVLATVLSLIILVLGLRSVFSLQVRQFPQTESATINVTTAYYGASSDVVAGFITTPLENAIAQAQGIDYLTSNSQNGISTINAVLKLNYDSNKALTEINTKVNSVLNQLPPQSQQPVLGLSTGESSAAMYLAFNSATQNDQELADYVERAVRPKLLAVPGVQQAHMYGGRFALRIWLDPSRLAGLGITAADVSTALANNNYLAAVGATKGQMVSVELAAGTDLHSVEEFRQLVVKQRGDALVRLEDVATVTLGADDYSIRAFGDGERTVFVGINVAPNANLLTTTAGIRAIFPSIQAQMPAGMQGKIIVDTTTFVNGAITEVQKTLVEALLIVTLVIFAFLGTPRSVLIPVIAMPLSLVGAFFVMLTLGYSINLLTLLALVLAIGLVVDDAIIVVENVDRHMKLGMAPTEAALVAARELGTPIISISVVLIAVYLPIGFQGGLTGALFSEFAFTLAGAVAVSAVIALTLSPMMCGRFLKSTDLQGSGLAARIDHFLERLTRGYQRLLAAALDAWKPLVAFGVIVIGLIWIMIVLPRAGALATGELAPEEDQSMVIYQLTAAPDATLDQTGIYSRQIYDIARTLPEARRVWQLVGAMGPNTGFGGVELKPWRERDRIAHEVQVDLQARFNRIPGARVAVFSFPPLPGGGNGLPLQFVVSTTEPFANLAEVVGEIERQAQASGNFYFIDSDLKLDKPQTTVVIDRDKAATLGLSMRDVGSALSAMLGGGYVNYFSIAGRSYRVIPQVQRADRLNAQQLMDYHIRTGNGDVVPAATVVRLETQTVPESINHFQQLNSATITGVSSVPLGQAIGSLRGIAQRVLPAGYSVDYAGQSRQLVQESSAFLVTLGFALIIIYLVLAAQFESFVDPLVVLMSVPMAVFGAMVFIFEGAATLNIYSEVGLVTLVGLIAKHGILIVQFANEQQAAGLGKRAAVEHAAAIRLRPILMTTGAMALGVVPLIVAGGAGAAARNQMGLVIFTGISVGTLFTLFVVPAMYLLLGRDHGHRGAAQAGTAQTGAAQSGTAT